MSNKNDRIKTNNVSVLEENSKFLIIPSSECQELSDGELEVVAGGEGLCLQAGKPVCGRCGVICVNGVPR